MTVDDFEGGYDPTVKVPDTSAPVKQTTPVAPQSPDESLVGHAIRSILPIPEEARNLLTAESPSWGDIYRGAGTRLDYIEQRAQRGIDAANPQGDWQKDPKTGEQFWVDPVTGRRWNKDDPETKQLPFVNTQRDLPRPDLLTGIAGSIAESATSNPLMTAMAPMSTAIGAGVNEVFQGAPSWERNLLAGAAPYLNPRQFLHLAMHGAIGHGVTQSLLHLATHTPSAVWQQLKDPRNLLQAIIGGHVAGEERPSSQPGRTTTNGE